MTEERVQTIRILKFSGNEEDWNRWTKTVVAIARIKGYRRALVAKNVFDHLFQSSSFPENLRMRMVCTLSSVIFRTSLDPGSLPQYPN